MATQHTTHASAEGFCLCHLKCVWHITGKLGIYMGYYNLGYVELERRFIGDEQLYVHVMAMLNLIASLAYLWLSDGWIYDRLIFQLYVPLYVYYLLLRRHLVDLLNECVRIHMAIERILGNWLCVRIPKECLYTLMLIIQTLLLLCCQMKMYYAYQMCFIAGVSIVYHLEILFFGNYLIWLGCLYRSSDVFVKKHMNIYKIGILRGILRQQEKIWRVHSIVIKYFSLHGLSFVGMVFGRIMNLVPDLLANEELNIDRLYMIYLITQSLHLALILIIAHNVQRQYEKFLASFLSLKDNEKYFQLKSWRLLRNQTLPMPFGLPLMRIPNNLKCGDKDVISMLFSSNVPAQYLMKTSILLIRLKYRHQLKLDFNLNMLFTSFVRLIRLLMGLLILRLMQHKHINYNFYIEMQSTQDNFDVNVTHTISQLYRWYNYDEYQ